MIDNGNNTDQIVLIALILLSVILAMFIGVGCYQFIKARTHMKLKRRKTHAAKSNNGNGYVSPQGPKKKREDREYALAMVFDIYKI